MLRAMLRIARTDLRSRRVQAAMLVLVVAASTTVLMLAVTVRGSAGAPFERLLDEANGAHV